LDNDHLAEVLTKKKLQEVDLTTSLINELIKDEPSRGKKKQHGPWEQVTTKSGKYGKKEATFEGTNGAKGGSSKTNWTKGQLVEGK